MTGVIFGSGIVGLVAKKVLSGNWTVVPFGRSRFYSFNPPLADNFISADKGIDQLVRDLSGESRTYTYTRAYSRGGVLVGQHDESACNTWLSKVFSSQGRTGLVSGLAQDADLLPGQSLPYMSKRMSFPIYGARVNQVYQRLQNEYMATLKEEATKGQISEIGKNYYVRGGQRHEFDRAISTIPLNALLDLLGMQSGHLTYADEHYVLVKSASIDLEGHNQALVADPILDFYKVTNLAPQHFMFYFLGDVPAPGNYLMPIIGTADILEGTKIAQAIPTGPTPNLDWLDDYGISCVGSLAQHDWCADVGSNFLKLVRLAQNGFKK